MEKLLNEFTVNRSIDHAWAVLTDVERIAPCLPGAQLQEVEGDVYRGVLKLKLGPIATLIAETGGLNAMIVDSSALLERATFGNVFASGRSAAFLSAFASADSGVSSSTAPRPVTTLATTSPSTICDAGRPKRMPPPRPRLVCK